MEVSQLPAELQEAILFHLDGSSLARAQRVCKLWKNCVANLGKVRNIWFEKCYQEVPLGSLKLLVGHAPRSNAGTWEQWRALYQRWYRSRFVKTWDFKNVWQQRHFTQSTMSDRSMSKPSSLLQFCGDEVVLYEWTEISRWHTVTGERLPTRDCVVATGAMNKKSIVVLNPLISPETSNADARTDTAYPCILIGLGNQIFLFTKSGMKSVQLTNFITCMSVWSRTLLVGWNTGAIDLYTLPDDLLTCERSQLLCKPIQLVPPILNNWQGGFFPQNITQATEAIIVGNRAFIIRAPNIEVWDVEKKLFLTSELYGSSHVRKLATNGIMVFCLTGSTLNWFEWSEENQELLPGQTPDMVPGNATCLALYGDLLALGTSEGLIYLYHINKTILQAENDRSEESSDSSDEDSLHSSSVPYSWDPVLSFKRMSIRQKTETMMIVECALRHPIRTISVTDCDFVEAIAISDSGSGPLLAAIGIKAEETWVQYVNLFSWSPG